MKPQKNKIVFALVLVGVVLFIVVYALLTFGKDKKNELKPDRIPMPDLEESQKAYGSKMEALDALKEDRKTTVPPIYPDHMVDDKGYFNPDYMEYEKQRIIDSVYSSGRLTPPWDQRKIGEETPVHKPNSEPTAIEETLSALPFGPAEQAVEHQLFFTSQPKAPKSKNHTKILVEVDGKHILRSNGRIHLRLVEATTINGHYFPKYTVLFGTVRFRPNRTLLHITQIGHFPSPWEAYDIHDGMVGIYVENSLREEASQEVVEDMVQDVNLAGLPQVRGLKSLFQRRQRQQRVTVLDGHRLVLKPKP